METLFIVNPSAGRGRCLNIWRSLEHRITIPYSVTMTQGPGDATKKARDAVKQGFKKIVSVGGDGTLNEVVNGIVGSKIELGVIPAGSGNDFAKTAGIPLNATEALEYAQRGRSDFIDLGKFNGSYFINCSGAGFDAEVVRTVNEDMRLLKGTGAYVASVLVSLIRFAPWDAVITVDGKIFKRNVWLIAAAKGKYFGGGMMIAPDASMESGQFDVCIVNKMSRFDIIRFLPKVFKGAHTSHPAFEVIRGKHIQIESEESVPIQVDGENKGRLPADFSVLPKAVKVIRYK